MDTKIAVVTGGNKGIGYAIVKGLCEKYKGIIYLTARDVSRGEEAVQKLKNLGFNPSFHQLDLEDVESIKKFAAYIKDTHGGLDLLVNNAGIAFKQAATEPFAEQAEVTVNVNYFGTLKVCEMLFPLLRKNGRVVNVSSLCGHLSKVPSADLKKKFSDKSLTVDGLSDLMKQFISDSKANKHKDNGWGQSAYNISKVGVSAMSIIQQRDFDTRDDTKNMNISVNSVHPGYVDTDMTSHKGPLTIEEGAKAPLYLSLEDHKLKGAYVWNDCKVMDWYADSITRD